MDEPIIVKVPLNQILVVPEDNPRGPYPQQAVLDMAATLKAGGQEMPILLRPRSAEERAKAHPDKPYKLVEGYLRTAGAPLASLTALDAIIRPMTPKEERRAAILANVRTDMNWLAWGEVAENLLADDPSLTHRQIGALIKRDHAWVTRALNLLKVLNKPAWKALGVNYTKPDGYDLPEACALALLDLVTGGEGDLERVEKTVKVALAQKMELKQVKKLVQWVHGGNNPEDFDYKGSKPGVATSPNDPIGSAPRNDSSLGSIDPFKSYWGHLGAAFKVKYKGGEDYEIHFKVKGRQAAWNAARAASQAMQGSPEIGDGPPPAPANPTNRLQPLIQTHLLPHLKPIRFPLVAQGWAWLKPVLAGLAQRYSRQIRRVVIGAEILGGLWLLASILLPVFVGQPSMAITTHPPALRSLAASPSKPEGRSGIATPGVGGACPCGWNSLSIPGANSWIISNFFLRFLNPES